LLNGGNNIFRTNFCRKSIKSMRNKKAHKLSMQILPLHSWKSGLYDINLWTQQKLGNFCKWSRNIVASIMLDAGRYCLMHNMTEKRRKEKLRIKTSFFCLTLKTDCKMCW
jgi:hypothetical protein